MYAQVFLSAIELRQYVRDGRARILLQEADRADVQTAIESLFKSDFTMDRVTTVPGLQGGELGIRASCNCI
jgi:hypothetical protein